MKNQQEGRLAERQMERQTAMDPAKPSGAGIRAWLWALFLIMATLAAYQPVWRAGFIWNDEAWLILNPALHSLHGLWRIWCGPGATIQYYPLTSTIFWLEYHLWGLKPLGYHLVNVLLHATNAFLFWLILRKLKVPGALLAAGIFALHPVCVETVAWVTEHKNTLSGLFYLSAILAGLKFWLPNGPSEPVARDEAAGWERWRFYWLALALYACALWSKTTTIPLPAVLLLLVWWKRGKIEWRHILQMLPFLAVGTAMGFVTMHVEKSISEQNTAGGGPFLVRALIAARDIWFYLGKLFWPHPLIFVYPLWKMNASQAAEYAPVLGLAAVFIVLWLKRKGWGRPILAVMVYFVMMLFLTLSFFNAYFFHYSYVADHFQYLASMGPLALAAAGMVLGIDFFQKGKPFLKLVLCATLLLGLGVLTWRQCGMYANDETLWKTTLARNPNCCIAYNNLGNILLQKGEVDEAMADYQKALEIDPNSAKAHYNLGDALLHKKGRMDEAMAHFQKAVEIDPDDPQAQDNLGNALLQKGEADEAMLHFKKALEINPGSVNAHYNLGDALLQKGRLDEAIAAFQKTLKINPDDPDAWNDLGDALLQKDDVDEAMPCLVKAVEIDPYFAKAHYNLGYAFLQKGEIDEAILHFQKAVEIDPDYVKAQNSLAWVLATCPQASLRNGGKAVELAQRATQLTGDGNAAVLRTLAAAYAEAGRFPEALEAARRALQLAEAQSNAALADTIQSQMQFYQAGLPFHLH